MKGNNTLKLNEATMREAVQMWVDKNMEGANVDVTTVKPDSSSGGTSSSRTFSIGLTERVALAPGEFVPSKGEPA